jgi:hypothetical protein
MATAVCLERLVRDTDVMVTDGASVTNRSTFSIEAFGIVSRTIGRDAIPATSEVSPGWFCLGRISGGVAETTTILNMINPA